MQFFFEKTNFLTSFSCDFEEKYLNLQNNKQKNIKKIITLKKYQNMNDADGQKT